MKLPDTFDVMKGHATLGQTYKTDMTRFLQSYMEFVLTRDGWVRVKWDVPTSEVLKGMRVAFREIGQQIETTAQSANQLAEAMRKWYGSTT